MTRDQLEHVVRAAGAITNESVILVLGSQSILGAFPAAPPPLDASREADLCPMHAPEKADLISGAIGEISQFDSTFGYYAHGLPLRVAHKKRRDFDSPNTYIAGDESYRPDQATTGRSRKQRSGAPTARRQAGGSSGFLVGEKLRRT